MSEEKTENPAPTKKEVEKQEQRDRIAEANAAADRMNAENDRFEQLLNRQEKMMVNQTFAGRAAAGSEPEKVEETPQEYAKRVTGA